MTEFRTRRIAAGLTLGVTGALLSSSPPAAASGQPPVTQPDYLTVVAGSRYTPYKPFANDSDPEGDRLQICSWDMETVPRGVYVYSQPEVWASQHAQPGTYAMTYEICDGTSFVSSTLHLTVLPPIRPQVLLKETAKPGVLRVVNKMPRRVRLVWGANAAKHEDGSVAIAKGRSKKITVHRVSIGYVVVAGREFGMGVKRGIRLPPDEKALPPGAKGVIGANLSGPWVMEATA